MGLIPTYGLIPGTPWGLIYPGNPGIFGLTGLYGIMFYGG